MVRIKKNKELREKYGAVRNKGSTTRQEKMGNPRNKVVNKSLDSKKKKIIKYKKPRVGNKVIVLKKKKKKSLNSNNTQLPDKSL